MPSNCDFSGQLDEIRDLISASPPPDTSALESRLDAIEAQLGIVQGELPIIQANALAGINAGQALAATVAGLAVLAAANEARLGIAESLARQAQAQALQAIGVGGQAINMAGSANSAAQNAMNAARNALGQAQNALGQAASNAGKIAGLVGKVAGIAAAIAGVGGLALGLANQAAINDLNRDMQDANARDRQHARDIQGLNERADSLNDKIGQVQNALEKQISELGQDLANVVSALRNLISQGDRALSQRISDLAALLRGLRDGIDGNNGLAGLAGRVNSLGGRVGALGSEVGTINQRLNGLSDKVDGLRNRLDGLTSGLGTATDTANRADTLSKLNAKQIASILAALAALGLAVAALQAQKFMCRYNDAQIGVIARATALISGAIAAMQGILTSQILPFIGTAGAALTTLTTGVEKIQKGVKSGFKWLAIDRVLNVFNLVGTLHNATFLSRDIIESLGAISDSVIQMMGKELRDSEGNQISTGQLIGGRIERAIVSRIGLKSYSAMRERWHRLSTIYTSAANVFGSLRSISDSIISGVEVAASYSAKIGNSLMRFGLLPEKVFPWMTENPNFDNKWISKLENAENAVSSISSVTSEVLSISEESKEIAKNSVDLKARLASKNPEDGTDWTLESGLQAEIDETRERATQFENITLGDIPYTE